MNIKTVVTAILIITTLTGCSSILSSVQKLSGPLMLNKGGFLDAESYNMILARKFPNGTASKDVLAYVKEQDGKCTQQEDSYSCKIYYYATLCISQSVELRFKELTELKTIYDLNAVHRFDGC